MKLVLVVVAVIVFASCGSDDASGDASVTGTVTITDASSVAVDGAVLTIQLVDVSLADAAATVLATDDIDLTDATFPLEFELRYEEDDIEERNTYAVEGRVEANDELLAINDTMTPAITSGAPSSGIELALIVVE